jgi:DNA-binding transcriptional LysR family regulator
MRAIDLNLLVVFDAVMEDRSVTLAGSRLGLSQPAMSHALARLRHALKDELFIRSPNGMAPTARAEELAPSIRMALQGLRHSLELVQFEPATAARNYRLAVDNHSAVVLVGPIAERITAFAPNVTLEFLPSGALDTSALFDADALDLAIGPAHDQGERFSCELLLRDELVVVLRKDHPLAGPRRLPMQDFATAPNLEISSIHQQANFVDEWLARSQLTRRIALRAPLLSAAPILLASDMVSILPRRIAEQVVRLSPLTIRPLRDKSPVVELQMQWSRRVQNEPAHEWLRQIVRDVAAGLGATASND